MLDALLKAVAEDNKKYEFKPGNFYQASVYAWNAFREGKSLTNVKYDTRKGLYHPAS